MSEVCVFVLEAIWVQAYRVHVRVLACEIMHSQAGYSDAGCCKAGIKAKYAAVYNGQHSGELGLGQTVALRLRGKLL